LAAVVAGTIAIAVLAVDADASPTHVQCFGKAAATGTNAQNALKGTPGDDVIAGLGGNDGISGDGGEDRLCGNTGTIS
jgi:Ca2+-binding RTX toxin-like protein